MCVNCQYCAAGIVGEVDGEDVYIWTHKKFDIGYNGKHIVDVNLTSESKVKLQPNIQLKFTYEVLPVVAEVLYCNLCDSYSLIVLQIQLNSSLLLTQFDECKYYMKTEVTKFSLTVSQSIGTEINDL